MNEHIRVSEVSAYGDGTLNRQANGYFDLSQAPDVENLRRLVVIKATKDADNVAAEWQGSVIRSIKTETEFIPPQYFGDKITFFWSRPFTEPEDRAAVEAESWKALEAAVGAVVAAGFDILPDPRTRL